MDQNKNKYMHDIYYGIAIQDLYYLIEKKMYVYTFGINRMHYFKIAPKLDFRSKICEF